MSLAMLAAAKLVEEPNLDYVTWPPAKVVNVAEQILDMVCLA
jgi:hypothetical protein